MIEDFYEPFELTRNRIHFKLVGALHLCWKDPHSVSPKNMRKLQIETLAAISSNHKCFDCNKVSTAANMDIYTFICSKCAGQLRELNFKTKSISASNFTQQELEMLAKVGNAVAKDIWMANWDPIVDPEPVGDNPTLVKSWLKKKYFDKKFMSKSVGGDEEFGEFQEAVVFQTRKSSPILTQAQTTLLELESQKFAKSTPKARNDSVSYSSYFHDDVDIASLRNPNQYNFFGSYSNIHTQTPVDSMDDFDNMLQYAKKNKRIEVETIQVQIEDEFSEFQSAPVNNLFHSESTVALDAPEEQPTFTTKDTLVENDQKKDPFADLFNLAMNK